MGSEGVSRKREGVVSGKSINAALAVGEKRERSKVRRLTQNGTATCSRHLPIVSRKAIWWVCNNLQPPRDQRAPCLGGCVQGTYWGSLRKAARGEMTTLLREPG